MVDQLDTDTHPFNLQQTAMGVPCRSHGGNAPAQIVARHHRKRW